MEAISKQYPEAAALRDLVNDAAQRLQTTWIWYLTYIALVVAAVTSTTHRMLFLETPLKLPLLSIDLNLVAFYIAAPVVLVLVHLYVMLRFIMLAESFTNFRAELPQHVDLEEERRKMQGHLNATVFLQALKQGRARDDVARPLSRLLLGGTMVAAPLLVLVFIQMWFLPYQSEVVTLVHRLLLLADAVMVSVTIEVFVRSGAVRPWSLRRWFGHGAAFSLVVASWLLLTFPEECWSRPEIRWADKDAANLVCFDRNWVVNGLFLPPVKAGQDDQFPRTGLHLPFSVTLALTQSRDLLSGGTAKSLAGRSFVYADFSGADLGGALFDDADLRHASFDGADVRAGSFRRVFAESAGFAGGDLAGADFTAAYLVGASFWKARIEGAVFQRAFLGEPQFYRANLTAAFLEGADIEGANLLEADLRLANLGDAAFADREISEDMEGAIVSGAFVMTSGEPEAFESALLHHAEAVICGRRNGAFVLRQVIATGFLPGSGAEQAALWRRLLEPSCRIPGLTDDDRSSIQDQIED